MLTERKPELLIVDDERDICEIVTIFLEGDFICHSANSGKEALNVVEEQQIDIVLTDFNMPGLDGLELAATLFEKNVAIPVVMLTGKGRDESRAQTPNVIKWIDKPFREDTLRSELLQALETFKSDAAGGL